MIINALYTTGHIPTEMQERSPFFRLEVCEKGNLPKGAGRTTILEFTKFLELTF